MLEEPAESSPAVGRPADRRDGHAGAGLRDRLVHRHAAFRARLRRRRTLDLAYRVLIGLLGAAITIGGLLMIPFPGPGWLIVFLGLGVLASEFAWAHRLLHFTRGKVTAFAHWAGAQPLAVRGLLAFGTLLIVVAVIGALFWWTGVPAWVPLLDP